MAKILVVDDDELGASTVKRALEELGGHEVVTASDGEAGLVAARQEIPDVILLDILMPKMNGYDMLKELKAAQETLNVPVIILSAVNDEESIKKALYEFDATYMTKPIEPTRLLQAIDHALSCKE